MLLRDLKVKIMETYKVAPFDQNLWVHGKYLTDPMKTLAQLQILPKSLIYLRADEPNLPGTANCLNAVEDTSWVVPQHDPQEGFKGRYIGSHLFTIMLHKTINPMIVCVLHAKILMFLFFRNRIDVQHGVKRSSKSGEISSKQLSDD